LCLMQVSTGSPIKVIPPEKGDYVGTTFSRDNEQIYFIASWGKNKFRNTLYRVPVLGGTPTKVLDEVDSPITFSPDGKQFAFVRYTRPTLEETSLMVANTDGSGEPKKIASRKNPNYFCVLGPSWSPDGRRIACGAGRTSGRSTETVVEVPVEGGPEKQVTSEIWENVFRVIWLEDGSGLIMAAKEEFFSAEGAQIWFLQYPSGAVRRITNDLSFYGTRSLGLTADSSTIATIQVTESFRVFVTAPNEEEGNAKEIIPRSPKIIFTFS